jgi:hypothetical protein
MAINVGERNGALNEQALNEAPLMVIKDVRVDHTGHA